MKRYLGVLLGGLMLAALVFAGACADDNGDGNGDGATPTPEAEHEDEDLFAMEAAETLSVDLHDIAYEPTQLEVPAGEVVEITLTNSGQLTHDFTIDEIDAYHMAQHMGETPEGHEEHGDEAAMHYALEPGDTQTVRLQVHEPGEYEFYCTVEGHRDAGMHGTLIVQ